MLHAWLIIEGSDPERETFGVQRMFTAPTHTELEGAIRAALFGIGGAANGELHTTARTVGEVVSLNRLDNETSTGLTWEVIPCSAGGVNFSH